MDKKIRFLDLTHTLREGIPLWDDTCIYKVETKGEDARFKLKQIHMECGAGTHLDAPYHLLPDGLQVDQIPLEKLMVDCKTIHIKNASEEFELLVSHLQKCEAESGPIRPNQFLLVHTGWDRFWSDPKKYINNYRFPSISKEAAKYLVEKKIAGLGIDTHSPDKGDTDFPVHSILLRKNIYIVENVAHAEKMPPNGRVFILPLKAAHLAEAPVRMIGTW